jgi:hypothetical protein
MARDLHEFREDLKQRPPPGSNAPPVGIRAKDLDENFTKVSLIESDQTDPKPYDVTYVKEGTRIENIRIAPDGEHDGDILFWKNDAQKWRVFPAVRDKDNLHVLGLLDGKLGWIKTQECD